MFKPDYKIMVNGNQIYNSFWENLKISPAIYCLLPRL